MTLWQAQTLFVRRLAQLLAWIYTNNGWEITLAEGYNGENVGHMAGSLHYQRLAQDFNLFVQGHWMTVDCPEWQTIGAYWESLGPENRWGGRFTKVDLDHFSIAWDGKA